MSGEAKTNRFSNTLVILFNHNIEPDTMKVVSVPTAIVNYVTVAQYHLIATLLFTT